MTSSSSTTRKVPPTPDSVASSSALPPAPALPPRHTYPPARSEPAHDTGASTLYDKSPHVKEDHLFRRRRARNSCGLDPLHVVGLIVAFGFFVLVIWPQLFSPEYWYGSRYRSPQDKLAWSKGRGNRRSNNRKQLDCALPPHCAQAALPSSEPTTRSPNSMVWQTTFTLPSNTKGCYLITKDVERACAEGLKGVKAGIASLTIQHTSAALSLNENYDSTVRTDMTMAMDRIVPESLPWKHVDEGPDDSASHTKASLFGATITLPITDGRFNLGTWQGIYLCEFRAAKHSRRVVATILS